MKKIRTLVLPLLLAPALILPTGCVVGGGYGEGPVYDPDVTQQQLGLDYYESFGFDYGLWGPGYRVGPAGRGERRRDGDGHETPHAYRPAPASRAVPGIPAGGRSVSGRPSGGRGHEQR